MTIIDTPLGRIRGREKHGALQFLGIRYGQSTAGENRFRPPVPVDPWDDVVDATSFGASAPQPPRAEDSVLPKRDLTISEDCLFLNVYTPAADSAARPVLFWIHGGSYLNGSGDAYGGGSFATTGDIVVVTINYRLGVFGFAEFGHLDESHTGSQNNGVLDMIAALEWVRDNIAAFGGDPSRVTICGESAGAGAVNALLCSPSARPLFHQAISESAPARFGPAGHEFINEYRSELGSSEAPATLEDMRSASVDDLLTAQQSLLDNGASQLGVTLMTSHRRGFRPAIDGLTLTANPPEAVASDPLPLLIGTNADEGTLFSLYLPAEISDTELADELSRIGHDAGAVIEAFRSEYPGESNRELAVRMLGDTLFRNSSLAVADSQADQHGRDCPVFTYLFTWKSQGFGGAFGAMHALEIPFVWNMPLGPWKALLGKNEPWPPDLSDRMHRAWIAFVKTGDPSHDGIGEWPAYDTDRRPTMEFGDTSGVLDDPHGTTRAAWLA